MAQRAGNADRGETKRFSRVVEDPLHTDHRTSLEQLQRCLLFVETDRSALDRCAQDFGQLVHIDFEPERERLPRRQPRPYASAFLAQYRFMQPELTAPEVFAPETLAPKY